MSAEELIVTDDWVNEWMHSGTTAATEDTTNAVGTILTNSAAQETQRRLNEFTASPHGQKIWEEKLSQIIVCDEYVEVAEVRIRHSNSNQWEQQIFTHTDGISFNLIWEGNLNKIIEMLWGREVNWFTQQEYVPSEIVWFIEKVLWFISWERYILNFSWEKNGRFCYFRIYRWDIDIGNDFSQSPSFLVREKVN